MYNGELELAKEEAKRLLSDPRINIPFKSKVILGKLFTESERRKFRKTRSYRGSHGFQV